MISFPEALAIVRLHTPLLRAVECPLQEAAGLLLATDLTAIHDVPPFDQSAMDGYAVRFRDLATGSPLRITSLAAAGMKPQGPVESGCATRIFTGAPLPAGADTVVIQEHTRVKGDRLWIDQTPSGQGANVRPAASQTRRGDTALRAGSRITPGAAGFLAGLGIHRVSVLPNPRVGILVTGNELIAPGQALVPGCIHESNSFALAAALREWGITPVLSLQAADEQDKIMEKLAQCLSCCDIVLTTGGVSVGDHDHVRAAAERCGVEKLFYKVRQRPGKPLFFGKHKETLVFGLPGNPASVLTAFYTFVVPALCRQTGQTDSDGLPVVRLSLDQDVPKKSGLTFFLRGTIKGRDVHVLHDQASYKMNSFAEADCLVQLEEDRNHYSAGETVEVLVLPHARFSTATRDAAGA